MKKLLFIALLLLFSCKEEEVTYLEYDFIIKEKVEKSNKFYIRSTKDSVLTCSAAQFIGWDKGDTIPMKIVQNGFWRGEHLLDK